jgi:hypothetical protein
VRGAEQLPTFDNEHDDVDYDGLHGYRLADAAGAAPRFRSASASPTDVRLPRARPGVSRAALATEHAARAVELAIPARAGDEVVQLYGLHGSRVARAPRELRAFARRLAPSEPGSCCSEVPIAGASPTTTSAGARGWAGRPHG